MAGHHTSRWELLEHWSPRLILAAGVLFVGHAIVRGIEAFTTMPPPADAFGPAGYVVALLGLLGLYPTLADQTPRTSRAAAGTAVVLAPVWALIAGWTAGEVAGVLPPETAVIPGAVFPVLILLTLLMYLLFGVASLRTDRHTRTLGILLLTPAALLVLLIVGAIFLPTAADVGGVIIGTGLAISHGAIGGTLLAGHTTTDHPAPSADATAE